MMVATRTLEVEAIGELATMRRVIGATVSPAKHNECLTRQSLGVLMNRWRVRVWYEASATPGFVHPCSAYGHTLF